VRRNKEIMILLGLLVGMMAFVLWYVIDRRAKNRLPSDAKQSVGQTPAGQQAGTGSVPPKP
jgi:zona occludens toxin (predicted ATPase)